MYKEVMNGVYNKYEVETGDFNGTSLKVAVGVLFLLTVLGPVPEIKGAPSLVIRLSNATAAALGKSDNYFPVTITYLQ